MTEKLRIAIVLPYFGPGGAEKMVSQLACGLDPRRFQTEVFCIYGQPQGNHLEQALRERDIPIHFIGKKKGPSVSAFVKLYRALDCFKPDVVHTHQYACVYAAPWPVLHRRPFLHTFHTLPEVENRRISRRILTKCLVAGQKLIPVAISKCNQQMVADFYRISPENVAVVSNPVDVRRFSTGCNKTDKPFRFITAGRFSPEKNQQMMFRAFAEFLKKGHDAKLIMLGRGEEEKNLKELALELGISEKVEYAGYVEDVEKYLASAHVFLLSSRYEAQPLSVLEAMAAGLPVISTDVGGVRDIVTDNGILVPADDVQAMARAMDRLYTEPAVYREMASCAIKNAAAYDVEHTVAGYEELYRCCAE